MHVHICVYAYVYMPVCLWPAPLLSTLTYARFHVVHLDGGLQLQDKIGPIQKQWRGLIIGDCKTPIRQGLISCQTRKERADLKFKDLNDNCSLCDRRGDLIAL